MTRPGTMGTKARARARKRVDEWPDAQAVCPSGTLAIGCMVLAGLTLSEVAQVARVERARLSLTLRPGRALAMQTGGRQHGRELVSEVLAGDEWVRLRAVYVLCAGVTPEALGAALEVGCDLVDLPRGLG